MFIIIARRLSFFEVDQRDGSNLTATLDMTGMATLALLLTLRIRSIGLGSLGIGSFFCNILGLHLDDTRIGIGHMTLFIRRYD